MPKPLPPSRHRLCKPLVLTERELRLLIVAAGGRLDRMAKLLAEGVITGTEAHRRLDVWRVILDKLSACAEEREEMQQEEHQDRLKLDAKKRAG